MNNYVTNQALECPSTDLNCILKDLFAKFSTPTIIPPTTVTHTLVGQILTITVNGVSTVITLP
jgi:hypothetical protein